MFVSLRMCLKGAQYICSICHQKFTRKFNGERHNENLHDSHATIMPFRKFHHTTYVRNKKFGFQPSSNPENKDEILSAALERIGKEFESCELELEMLSPQERAMHLAPVVVNCLSYEDPKLPMIRYLKGIRKNRLNNKIIECVADGYKTTPSAAKQMLKEILS